MQGNEIMLPVTYKHCIMFLGPNERLLLLFIFLQTQFFSSDAQYLLSLSNCNVQVWPLKLQESFEGLYKHSDFSRSAEIAAHDVIDEFSRTTSESHTKSPLASDLISFI